MRVYESDTHPYSEVRLSPDGLIAYVSGVLPYNDDGDSIETAEARAPEVALNLLARRLAHVGMTLRDVLKTTVFVTDISWRESVNKAYLAAFEQPMPARTIVEVRSLPKGSPIEIDAIAARGSLN